MRVTRQYLIPTSVVLVMVGCVGLNDPQPLLEEPPAFIVNGSPDGDAHPNAGAFLIDVAGTGQPNPFSLAGCSGFLIAPTVFLTAAHCLGGPPASVVKRWVTFGHGILNPNLMFIPVTEIHRHPDFVAGSGTGNDIGVMLLAHAPAGIDPVRLPPRGFLDELAEEDGDDDGDDEDEGENENDDEEDGDDDDGLRNRRFTVVGYGLTLTQGPGSLCVPIGFPFCFYFDGLRRAASTSFLALDPLELVVDQNPAAGNGGVCFGDSGAPFFFGDTDMVVAVGNRIAGAPICQGRSFNARLDTRSAREFLKAFLDDDDDDDDDEGN